MTSDVTRALRTVLISTVLLTAALGSSRALAQDEPSDARALIESAVAEYQARRYPEALALFRRAHALEPNARTLRGIGMASFETRQYVEALRALEASLVEELRPLTDEQRTHVEELLTRTRSYVGRVHLQVVPAEADVRIDGVAIEREPDGAVLLDAGRHEVTASHHGYVNRVVTLAVDGGEEPTVRVELEAVVPVAPAAPLQPPLPTEAPAEDLTLLASGMTGLVLGLLTGGAAVATGLLALESQAELEDECLYGVCPGSLADNPARARALATATDVLWISGAALAATGIALLIAHAASSSETPVATAACTHDGCLFGIAGSL